jgi:hypothetical protein
MGFQGVLDFSDVHFQGVLDFTGACDTIFMGCRVTARGLLREWSYRLYSLGRLSSLAQNMCQFNTLMAVPLFLEISGKVECRATFKNSPAIRLRGYQREILAR